MSEESTLVSSEHFRYVAEHTVREDAFLTRLKEAAREADIPPIWIAPEQASLMQILLRASGARRVVEVGTLAGCSAIWLARALPPDGKLHTIEFEPRHAAFAREWIGRSDVAERIEVLEGAGADVLPRFQDDSMDAAFLDADKKSYSLYLEQCLRIVRPGGLIMVDNAFAFGLLFEETDREAVHAVRAFNNVMAREERLQGVIVPLGDGLWVAVRRSEEDK